jgi:DNA-binding CsgD family transcriptional regulator
MLTPEVVGADRAILLRAMVDALAARRGSGRLIVFVDDAHLLDDASAALIGLLATSGTASVVAAVRDGEPVSKPISDLAKEPSGLRLDLRALSGAEAAQVLEEALDGQVDQATARRLTGMAAGNMLFLRELVVGGLSAGSLRCESEVWHWHGPLAPTRSLTELIAARLTELDAEERRALELVAVGEPIELRALQSAAPIATLRRLERRVLIDVFRLRGALFARTSHPLYGEVVRSEMPPLRRAEVRLALAAGLESNDGYRDDDAVRIVLWRLDAGDPPAPGVLLRAARRMLALSDPLAAERLARAAGDAGGGIAAQRVLADTIVYQGRVREAAALLEGLNPQTDEDIAAIADSVALWYAFHLGEGDRGAAILAAAERKVSGDSARYQLLASQAAFAWGQGHLTEALDICGRIRRSGADEHVQVRTALNAATAWSLRGQCLDAIAEADRTAPAVRRCVAELPWVPSQFAAARSLALYLAGELPRMVHDATSGYEQALVGDDEEARAVWAAILGLGHLESGRVRTAARHLREAVLLNRQRGLLYTRSALLYLACALALSGDPRAGQDALNEADTLTVAVPALYRSENLRIRACLLAVRGQAKAAQRTALDAAATASESTAWSFALWALHDAARWGAASAAAQLGQIAPRVDGALAPVIADHARALQSSDPQALEDVARRFEGLGLVLYAAEAAMAASAAYEARGQRYLAITAGRRAAALAARCEGAMTPVLLNKPRSPLTAREEQVAVLATAGITDKDIAERLSVSVRTVHAHLRNIYAKLGIPGRRELGGHFDAQPEPDPGL